MKHFPLALLLLLVTASSVSAQADTPAVKTANSSARNAELAERQSLAVSLLNSLAIEARSYRDEYLRARVQARVADVLWDRQPENARSLFRRAWDIAEAVETGSSAGTSMLGRRAKNQPLRPPAGLRAEILRLAARRDRALGEEFLARMTSKKSDKEVKDQTDSSSASDTMSEEQIAERLKLAQGFLESGDVERSLQFADPALNQVARAAIQFLVALRAKDPVAADRRYAALLLRAANDPSSDANTVSLLTTYAFTPSMYMVVSPVGIPSSMYSDPVPPPDLAPALRANYFQVAANILLRPFAQLDQSTAGRAGTYFIATRLLPLFQQFAPELAPAVSSQLAALGPEASATTRQGGDWLNQGMKPPEPGGDPIGDDLTDRLSRAKTADARDRIYAMAAMRAADKADPRAHEFVDKIEDLNTRNGIRSFVDYNLITGLLRKKRVDEAVALARKADLSHILRAHVLTQAAAIVADKDAARANEFLEEALTEILRIEASAPERAYSLVALLAGLCKVNKVRTWELLSETIKSANALPDFTGEDGHTSQTVEGKFSIQMGAELISEKDLPDIFATLAQDDFYQSVNAGKSFRGEAPRALATIAITRATLKEKASQPPKR